MSVASSLQNVSQQTTQNINILYRIKSKGKENLLQKTFSGLDPTFDGEYEQYYLNLSLSVSPDMCLNELEVCDMHLIFLRNIFFFFIVRRIVVRISGQTEASHLTAMFVSSESLVALMTSPSYFLSNFAFSSPVPWSCSDFAHFEMLFSLFRITLLLSVS